jgi:hypothetical protein
VMTSPLLRCLQTAVSAHSLSPTLAAALQDGSSVILSWYVSLTIPSTRSSHLTSIPLQKNVYSVFRYNPASVGFAELSQTATSMNGADGEVPSPTVGSVVASVSATGSASNRKGPDSGALGGKAQLSMLAAVVAPVIASFVTVIGL